MTVVYLVHCIDTEGPLAESPLSIDDGRTPRAYPRLESTDIFSPERLEETIAGHRAKVLGSWEEIMSMLRAATAPEMRGEMPDSFGGHWRFNWFCMDHLDFIENPRRRAMGIHAIYDFYSDLVQRQGLGDAVHWHFHPTSTYGQGHRCATSYLNSPSLYETLCRRLIDRQWFPRANRAGFQDERPDSHWFLEQWIPFDLSNFAAEDIDPEKNPDMVDGRFSDWRWAPRDWSTYTPNHDCHQIPGHCRRKIARCLTVLNRVGSITQAEVDAAFARAASGLPTLMAFSSHDWRDLGIEVDHVRSMVAEASTRHPGVRFKYADAIEAFNAVHPAPPSPALRLDCVVKLDEHGRPCRIEVETGQGAVFGPQPFLAVRTRSRRYIHDNFNYWRDRNSFNFSFDEHSILPEDVSAFGVATNDAHGNQSIHVLDVDSIPHGTQSVSF